MGDVVSGYILSHSFGISKQKIFDSNRTAISQLPKNGAYLIDRMFSQLPLNIGHTNTFQVIHFAASYDEMYGFDREWIEEFEQLLSKLSWWSATAFQSYTGIHAEWLSKDHDVDNESIPTRLWSVEYFSSYHELSKIPENEAVY